MNSDSSAPIRILIVDDHIMIREALAALLALESDITIVGQAGTGAEALTFLSNPQHTADVVLLDIEMPELDGLTTCAAIRSRFPEIRVLVLTTFGRPGYVQRALDAGASGFLVKDSPSKQLADAVRRVFRGERTVDPVLAVEALTRGPSPLTDRETDVLRIVSSGGTIADIARTLALSQGTVRNHVSNAMVKTGARTRSEAARIATESGWL